MKYIFRRITISSLMTVLTFNSKCISSVGVTILKRASWGGHNSVLFSLAAVDGWTPASYCGKYLPTSIFIQHHQHHHSRIRILSVVAICECLSECNDINGMDPQNKSNQCPSSLARKSLKTRLKSIPKMR